jgi:N-acetylmuramoyl-L-alanine amidase
MPATKLIKIHKAVMRQSTKIRGLKDILKSIKIQGLKDILISALILASITMPMNVSAQALQSEKEWVVVIDPGHGGRDPGAPGSKSKEKNINLAVALKTGNYIKQYLKDVKVIYTREDDTLPGLDERAALANRNKADIFISIHSNGMNDKRFIGAETYVMGPTKDEANLQVVMKENSVITFEDNYHTKYEGYDPNSVESFIIFSLMQNTYLKQSTEFATMVQSQFRDRVGRKDRGVKQGNLLVLWKCTMPAVLVELGFISNPEEEKFLLSEQGQDYLASAIFRAFRDYKESIDSRSGLRNGHAVVADKAKAGGTGDISGATPVSANSGNSTFGNTTAAGNADSATSRTTGERESASIQSPSAKETVQGQTGPDSNIPAKEQAATTSQAQAMTTSQAQALTQAEVTSRVKESLATPEDNIFFMVQISAMPRNRELSQNQLKDIDTITKIDAGERVKYAAGRFKVYDDALKYRRMLTASFPDAFVIAVRNGKIVPLREAIDLKKKK